MVSDRISDLDDRGLRDFALTMAAIVAVLFGLVFAERRLAHVALDLRSGVCVLGFCPSCISLYGLPPVDEIRIGTQPNHDAAGIGYGVLPRIHADRVVHAHHRPQYDGASSCQIRYNLSKSIPSPRQRKHGKAVLMFELMQDLWGFHARG